MVSQRDSSSECWLNQAALEKRFLNRCNFFWIITRYIWFEKDDKGSTLMRIGVSGWEFLLVPAYPGCPGSKAVKRSCVCVHDFDWSFRPASPYLGLTYLTSRLRYGNTRRYDVTTILRADVLLDISLCKIKLFLANPKLYILILTLSRVCQECCL